VFSIYSDCHSEPPPSCPTRRSSDLIMEGLANTYKESGWLPEWASPGHRDCMIGSNSASLIADAYLKGIRGYDINTLYEGLLKNRDRKSTRLNSSHVKSSYAVFCLKK